MIKTALSLLPNCLDNLCLGYKTLDKFDGLGAQLQRVLAVRGLSKYLNIKNCQPRIDGIATHPLDGLQNPQKYEAFLNRVNYLIEEEKPECFSSCVMIDDLTTGKFLRYIWLASRGHKIKLLITHPYRLVDSRSVIYAMSIDARFKEKVRLLFPNNVLYDISYHHRHGTGNFALQPGQKTSREVDLKHIIPLLTSLSKKSPTHTLHVFTDAPENEIIYKVLTKDITAWKGLSSITGEEMKVSSQNFRYLENAHLKLQILRGGDPLESLIKLSNSNTLILSRSSFGFVAAIIAGHSNVYLPKDFWHPRLPDWKVY